jgi:hypothetical protein
VSWNSSGRNYTAKFNRVYLGNFATKEEAACVYARAYLSEHRGPPAPNVAVQSRPEAEGDEAIDLEPFRTKKSSSGYLGDLP